MTVELLIRITFLSAVGLKFDFLTDYSISHRRHNMLFSEYHVLSASKPVQVLRVPRVKHLYNIYLLPGK